MASKRRSVAECELCKAGIENRIDSLRSEIRQAAAITSTLTAVFISILGVLLAIKAI